MVALNETSATSDSLESLLDTITTSVALIGVRGYFAGASKNQAYQDAMFVWSPNGFMGFNACCKAQTDDSDTSFLKDGVWQYRIGVQNDERPSKFQYPALVQAAPVTVTQKRNKEKVGWFNSNIHRGPADVARSSCSIAIKPSQWVSFFNCVKTEMSRAQLSRVALVLASNILE